MLPSTILIDKEPFVYTANSSVEMPWSRDADQCPATMREYGLPD